MAFFDFMNPDKGGLSLAEMLGIPWQVGGQYLMRRDRRVGGPLGAALTGFGALGQQLGQRQDQQKQNQAIFGALQKIDPRFAEVAPIVQAGGSVTDAMAALKEKYPQTKAAAPFPVFNQQTGAEQMFDPSKGGDIPQGFVSSSFYKPAKPGKETLPDRYFAEHPKATWEDYQRDVGQTKMAGEKSQISWRWETTPEGRAVQNAYRFNPATGTEERVQTAGAAGGIPARLNAAQQKQVDSTHEVTDSLPVLQQYVQALPPNLTPAMMAREYAKYRTPIGALSRSQTIINELKPHIPAPTDPPGRAMEKMQAFQRGAFDSTLQAILGGGAAPTDAGARETAGMPSTSPPPKPDFEVAKTYQKDGQWYVQDPKGQFYQ